MKIATGLAVGALGLGGIAATIGVVGLTTADNANVKVDAVIEARDNARKISCDAANDQQLRSRAGDDRQTRVLFESLATFTSDPDDPEIRAFLERLYADQAKASEESYPLRDCSPEGIARFYEEHP